ncbi:MAG: hypothetical protein A2087_02175 [Spirochaetes bacterium GWD1_61_31]|nr:MAG: hypothetical protein A2Y37_11910 [Spirochaetes bacterium GWB1_60_80]OHD33892.1 MAG: hypothetical protein A2004_01280 [Spirochaetes bacterium GWC1_61_12]OHD43829.1 MAG: hypothetical protein A2087_02175 [Spirochaetes bacterium GWD1_61_31]OHD46072.1 MAG: hypothetical protein A2Y35_13735 [Spirochaetes bacterium GWE1_60_18]OHD60644.1 MAG: hypothetical protein A2Y32_08225 [Spirochaetes bacterium GWF1_60_12]HAP44262.1 hypothetical protein [Spirochaetaceae bacterium]
MKWLVAAVCLAAALLLSACPGSLPTGYGQLQVSLPAAAARGIGPRLAQAHHYRLELTPLDASLGSAVLLESSVSLSETLEVPTGDWNLLVQAFKADGTVFGAGQKVVSVVPGLNQVSLDLAPTLAGGLGEFEFRYLASTAPLSASISLNVWPEIGEPKTLLPDGSGAFSLVDYSASGILSVTVVNDLSLVDLSGSIAAGDYILRLELVDGQLNVIESKTTILTVADSWRSHNANQASLQQVAGGSVAFADYPGDADHAFIEGENINLVAVPANGYFFDQWLSSAGSAYAVFETGTYLRMPDQALTIGGAFVDSSTFTELVGGPPWQYNGTLGGAGLWLSFTVTTTGYYTIVSSGSLDTKASLRDSASLSSLSLTDGGVGLNFSSTPDLSAGTYYLKVELESGSGGDFVLDIAYVIF